MSNSNQAAKPIIDTHYAVKELRREINMRHIVFGKQVQQGKLDPIEAANRIDLIVEIKDLVSLMHEKGISFKQVRTMIGSATPVVPPGKLF